MYDSSVEINLPDTFYAALDKVVDVVREGFDGNSGDKRTELYRNNLLNYTETQTFIPKFEERHRNDYIKIGRSLMEGMSDIFFDRFERYNDEKDYYKNIEKTPASQIVPVVNVNVEQPVTPNNNSENGSSLLSMIPIAALLGGIAAGTTAYGQLIESIALLPKLIKNAGGFANTIKKAFSAIPGTITKLNALGKTIAKSFTALANSASKIPAIGNSAAKVITKVGGTIGNIGTILAGKVGQLGAKLASKLKFLPIIGSALGFYQTYLRLSRGEVFLGILEFAAAVSSLLPGPGTAIAIGINVIQTLIEHDSTAAGGVTGLVIKKIAGAGASLLPKLAGSISSLIAKPLALVLKKIPFIGPIISFGMAVSDFINGSTLSGVFNVMAGLAGLIDFVAPGVGTAIAIAIDALNFFLTTTDTGKEVANSIGNFFGNVGEAISTFFVEIYDRVIKAGKAVAEIITVAWNKITEYTVNTINSIHAWITDTIGKISATFTNYYNIANKALSEAYDFITDLFDFSEESNLINSVLSGIKDAFVKTWYEIKNFFKNAWTDIKEKTNALMNGFIEKTKSFGKNIISFFTDDSEEASPPQAKAVKQPDARIVQKPEEQSNIDTALINNQLTNDRHIRSIATDLARSDNAAGLGLNKLCGITEVILSELIKKPSGLSSITTNNIISNGGNISRTSSIRTTDPRTAYSH